MASQKDIKDRISSVKNIRKITRAMEMISAARLRKAEQRIEALRPYADALRRMTARASQAADNIPNLPILQEKENVQTVGILLITGDRGLAGPFNSQILRAGNQRLRELKGDGKEVLWYAVGRRGVRRRQGRPRRGLLQRLHLAGEPGGPPRDAAAPPAGRRDCTGSDPRRGRSRREL